MGDEGCSLRNGAPPFGWLRFATARVSAACRGPQVRDEIAEELQFHIAMRTRENVERGMSPAEAALQAQRQFGNLNSLRDACHDVSGGGVFETVAQDLRFAVRMLLKDRGFSAIALLVLALTIGANTAVFALVNRVLLRPLPFPESHNIVSVWSSDADRVSRVRVSYPDFEDLRAENKWFERFGVYMSVDSVLHTAGAVATRVRGARVTADVLPLLGVDPAVGRVFFPSDDEPGARAAMISHELWQKQWRGVADIIGQELEIDGSSHHIVGVMPAGFRFPMPGPAVQVWTTVARDREPPVRDALPLAAARQHRDWQPLGRLKRGVTIDEARSGLSAVTARLAEQYPDINRRLPSCDVAPLLDATVYYVRPQILLLFGAALCVLGVGCANLATLSLARAGSRQKEFAVRAALGAGRARILRQLLTESLLLATIGGLIGLLAAFGFTRCIIAMLPEYFPRACEIGLDLPALLFAGVVTLATTVLFGVTPAWRAARNSVAALMKETAAHASPSRKQGRARMFLVACEVVLAFLLLAGAGFFLRAVWHLQNIETGFDARDVVTMRVSAAVYSSDKDPEAVLAEFWDRLLTRVRATAQVESASIASALPLIGRRWSTQLLFADRTGPRAERAEVFASIVGTDFFRTMRIPLVSGRDFTAADTNDSPGVIIITASLARTYFPGENPLGQRMTARVASGAGGPLVREIVGVVEDLNYTDVGMENEPGVFVPFAQCLGIEGRLVVRSKAAPEVIFASVRRTVAELDNEVAVYEEAVVERLLHDAMTAQPRLSSTLLAAFAGFAVLLTAIGVYGVTSYFVAQQRRAIGIRLALGAPRRAVFRLIVGEPLRMLQWAIPLGAACTALSVYLLRGFLHQPGIADATIVAFVAALVAGIAMIASWLPARRAMRIDPVDELRRE